MVTFFFPLSIYTLYSTVHTVQDTEYSIILHELQFRLVAFLEALDQLFIIYFNDYLIYLNDYCVYYVIYPALSGCSTTVPTTAYLRNGWGPASHNTAHCTRSQLQQIVLLVLNWEAMCSPLTLNCQRKKMFLNLSPPLTI